MPNGKIHAKASATLGTMLIPLALVRWEFVFVSIGVFLTIPIRLGNMAIYLNPDMDIRLNRNSWIAQSLGIDAYEKVVKHRAGMRISHYREAIRSPFKLLLLSHAPFIGTVARSMVVIVPYIVLALAFAVDVNLLLIISVYLGMAISDTLHIIMDGLT